MTETRVNPPVPRETVADSLRVAEGRSRKAAGARLAARGLIAKDWSAALNVLLHSYPPPWTARSYTSPADLSYIRDSTGESVATRVHPVLAELIVRVVNEMVGGVSR